MVQESTTTTWDFQNINYEPSTTAKLYVLFLLIVCIITGIKLIRIWRTAPLFRLERQVQNPAYCKLLQRSANSLKQWIGLTFLSWGIFVSIGLYDVCRTLLELKAFGGLLLIYQVLGFSTGLTAVLLVALFVFLARWHVLNRIEHLRNS